MQTDAFETDLLYVGDRPTIPVRLTATANGPSRQFDAVLDTGANATFFGRDVAVILGIKFTAPPDSLVRLGDGTTQVSGWVRLVTLEILPLGLTLAVNVSFIDGRRHPPLIGTTGVMDHLWIGIRHSERRLFLGRDR